MPSVKTRITDLAVGGVQEILTGTEYEYPPNGRRGNTYAVAVATDGVTTTNPLVTVTMGQRNVGENLAIGVESAAGRGPIVPEDLVCREHALPGERVRIRITNADSAVRDFVVLVDIT